MKKFNRTIAVTLAAIIALFSLTGAVSAALNLTRYAYTLKTEEYTNSYMGISVRARNYCAKISAVSQFVDERGRIGFAYDNADYVYIERLNKSFKRETSLKIKKKYPLLGAATCDNKGNYYIVWGQNDDKGNGGVETIAVSKYTASGEFVKTAAIKSSSGGGMGQNATQYPFQAGNCAVAINNGVLVCSYARKMYKIDNVNHQSNAVIAVETDAMKLISDYDFAYSSHSFDQRVFYSEKLNTFVFADHGDAYPRGFKISYNENDINTLHFYEEPGYRSDMYKLNQTNAQLGGIGEVSAGLVLVGASAKSYTANYTNERRQLFIQIYNPETKTYVTSGSRKDGSGKVIDNGVKWLTDYKSDYIENPQLAVAGDKIVVMWERFDKNHVYAGTRYMLLSAKGEVLKKTTSLGNARLNAFEEPQYINGSVYWVTANGKSAVVNALKIDG